MVIAIDGPGGVGKSTVSRTVAERLGLPYLDTGSTYRAATVAVLDAGSPVDDEAAILDLLDRSIIGFGATGVTLDGVLIADRTRDPDVTSAVSAVSAHPGVRIKIVEVQRRWVADHGGSAVVEGRDIGTVVFPDAEVKVFLTARPEIRATRRAGDAEAAGASVSQIRADLERRDRADSSREASPMRAADDAVTIDTSDRTIGEVVVAILDLVPENR